MVDFLLAPLFTYVLQVIFYFPNMKFLLINNNSINMLVLCGLLFFALLMLWPSEGPKWTQTCLLEQLAFTKQQVMTAVHHSTSPKQWSERETLIRLKINRVLMLLLLCLNKIN